jgi:hypothetical protein
MALQRASAWFLALSILVLGASGAFAQKIQKEAATAGVTGKIMKVSPGEKTLTVDGPDDDGEIYWVDDKASIMNGDKKITLGDLKVGWTVVLNFDKADVKRVATYIEVVDAP